MLHITDFQLFKKNSLLLPDYCHTAARTMKFKIYYDDFSKLSSSTPVGLHEISSTGKIQLRH
jgi:hypothetical protein